VRRQGRSPLSRDVTLSSRQTTKDLARIDQKVMPPGSFEMNHRQLQNFAIIS
jgi:hypothetical protein